MRKILIGYLTILRNEWLVMKYLSKLPFKSKRFHSGSIYGNNSSLNKYNIILFNQTSRQKYLTYLSLQHKASSRYLQKGKQKSKIEKYFENYTNIISYIDKSVESDWNT